MYEQNSANNRYYAVNLGNVGFNASDILSLNLM